MKIVFAGSSEYAIPALEKLIAIPSLRPILVISQPARPKGRKQRLEETPLAQFARGHGLELFCPEGINSPESVKRILDMQAELLITASYGGFLGRRLRQGFAFGAINLHPSLLPKHRGSTPIRAALLAGDKVTGNSIFRLVAKMDAGPILLQKSLSIKKGEAHGSLHDRLAIQAAEMLLDLVQDPASWQAHEQEHSLATFTRMIERGDLRMDFSLPAEEIDRRIRAYSPEPGAFTTFRGQKLKILTAEPILDGSSNSPGSISQIHKNEGFNISTGKGSLMILRVQPAGKKVMDSWAWHLGARLQMGERFGE